MAEDSATWAAREFHNAKLGDVRRNHRAEKVVLAMASGQVRSIPLACETWAATKGCYRVLNHDDIDHAALLSGHVAATIERARACRVVLAIEDGSSLSFKASAVIKGLGPVSTSKGTKGVMLHTTLLLNGETGETLGVSSQQPWVRPATPARKGESGEDRKKRRRESEVWARETKALCGLLRADHAEPPQVVSVMDREGDIYEVLHRLRAAGSGFVIRAVHNRKLAVKVGESEYSLDAVMQAPSLGELAISVPRKGNQKEREARLTVRVVDVVLAPPKNLARKGDPFPVRLVVAREEAEGVPETQRLCWFLLTDRQARTLAEASEVTRIYTQRWRIEEFHMGLKTGCGSERVQFHDVKPLLNYLALATITAWRVLSLRDAARERRPLPEAVISDLAMKLLHRHDKKLVAKPDAREILRAIARLGGFLSRTGDGEPGWRTIWAGLRRLEQWEAGARLLLKEAGTASS